MRRILTSFLVIAISPGLAQSSIVGVFDGQSPASSTQIAAHLNANGHTATNFSAGAINAATLAGLDVAILLRANGNADLTAWVNAGGKLITEWTSADWAANASGMLDATISGGGFVANPDLVTFTASGLAMGLGDGLPNPYSDQGRTDFFRLVTNPGTMDILATRSSGEEAILGDDVGSGYVVLNVYDWADWTEFPFTNLDRTKQLLLNMVEMGAADGAVPEPLSLAVWSLLACCVGLVYARVRAQAA
jgi:hypothetical protein